MKEKIKKTLIFIITILGLFLVYNYSSAHPGNTASDGCHYCRTNCDYWGVPWNQRHCHGGGSSSPIYDYPSYAPSIPSCPSNSYYDSISSSCKCYSGYVVSNGQCISMSQWCQDQYGIWATQDYLTDSCKCVSGYVFGKDFLGKTACVSASQYCRDAIGYNSRYNSLTDNCECSYGYVFDSNNQCVSEDSYCQDIYGYYSEYNTLSDKCVCKSGYILDSLTTKCISGSIYCKNTYGSNISYNSLTKICVCDNGYKFINNRCVAPEISRIYPLEITIGEEVTIQGKNFGSDKYGDLKLYIGSVRVNTSDISKWQDDKIIFKAKNYLKSGYVSLKNSFIDIRSSYLTISELEEEPVSINYSIPSIKEPIPEAKTDYQPQQQSETPKITNENQDKELSQNEQNTEKQNEPVEKEQKSPAQFFLANIFNAIKSFFRGFFH